MRYGAPLNHARYGILVLDDDGKLICGECGKSWSHLATHLFGAHGITAAQYREKYGLGRSTRLVAEGPRSKMREKAVQRMPESIALLEKHRDPIKASHASRQLPWAPETRAKRQAIGRSTRSRNLTPAQIEQLGDGIDLQAFADGARALVAEGVAIMAIARAFDISDATVHQRMRRYPPKS